MAQREPAQAIVQVPVKKEEEEEPEYVTASIAKSAEYGLKEKDLDTLVCKRVPNPQNRRAAPMRLYIRSAFPDTCGPLPVAWYLAGAVKSISSWIGTLNPLRSERGVLVANF